MGIGWANKQCLLYFTLSLLIKGRGKTCKHINTVKGHTISMNLSMLNLKIIAYIIEHFSIRVLLGKQRWFYRGKLVPWTGNKGVGRAESGVGGATLRQTRAGTPTIMDAG